MSKQRQDEYKCPLEVTIFIIFDGICDRAYDNG